MPSSCVSRKNSHALRLSLLSPLVLPCVIVYVCNCSFPQPSNISTRSVVGWEMGRSWLQQKKKPLFALHNSPVAGAGAWGSPSCSCWPFMKASLKRFASGKLYRVLVYGNIDGGRKRREVKKKNLLSLLANRIASVWGSPAGFSLTSIAVFHTQLRSLPTLGESFMSGTTITGGIIPISTPPHQHAFSRPSRKE